MAPDQQEFFRVSALTSVLKSETSKLALGDREPKLEISKLQGALKRIGPHASSPEFEQKVSEFLEQRSKPKH
jgi:hypothetical protein